MTAIENRVSDIKTSQLIEIIESLVNKIDENSDLVFEIVFSELKDRLSEDDFLNLCNQIEKVM